MDRNYDVITFISKYQNIFTLRWPGVSIFAYIIKIVAMFIKTIIKDSRKLKELEVMFENSIYICFS